MERKKLLLLIAALAIAVGAAVLARSLFTDAGAASAAPEQARRSEGPRVLVAQRGLPAGTIITADALAFRPWPAELVQDAYFLSGDTDATKLLGTVVRYPITAGEPVTQGSLVEPGDRGFLAAALAPGMRAVTVPVSAKTGVGGFVFPGDRVDLVLTQTIQGADQQELSAAETIVGNLRVLATDQSTANEIVDGKTVVRTFKTVTLEVTPKIAEKIAVAEAVGDISLSLRALAGSGSELDEAIATGRVEVPDGLDTEAEEELLRTAMNQPVEAGRSFVTGGHVSRFQRRTLPPRGSSGPPPPPPPAVATTIVRAPVSDAPDVNIAVTGRGAGPTVRVTRGKETIVVPVGRN